MSIKKIMLQSFAVYGVVCAASKLSRSYLDNNGKAIATGVAAKVIDFIFDEYEPKTRDKKPISFETRKEAREVLNELEQIIVDYGYATIGDIYEIIGRNSTGRDMVFGWKDLDKAKIVRRKHNDYRLKMPKPHKVA